MITSELKNLFDQFHRLKILVIGDVMVDRYIRGNVDRISPEAPVPVVIVSGHEDHLGGAANVALNIKALGGTPILASSIGSDETGNAFLNLMKKEGLSAEAIQKSDKPTTLKMRIMGNNHQLLRVDEEDDRPMVEPQAEQFRKMIIALIQENNIDGIIFEDYDKGLIDEKLIREVVREAGEKSIPVSVDPKRRNFSFYRNVTLFKPNLKEIREGLKIEADPTNKISISNADQELRKLLNHKYSLITLSEHGSYASEPSGSSFIPAHVRKISDVSGAGDTVIGVASMCLAAGIDIHSIAFLSNLAGGLVCEKPGVVPIDSVQLFEEAMRFIETRKKSDS